MPVQMLINIFIALLWMFLQDEWSILAFFAGYLVGLLVLFCLRRFLKHPFYLKTVIAVANLLFVFIRELILSSIYVVRQIVRPKLEITPGIFKIETELESDWEVTLLSLLLTLTPGSVVMEVASNGKELFMHGLNLPESEESVLKSKKVFERAIKEVTRFV